MQDEIETDKTDKRLTDKTERTFCISFSPVCTTERYQYIEKHYHIQEKNRYSIYNKSDGGTTHQKKH